MTYTVDSKAEIAASKKLLRPTEIRTLRSIPVHTRMDQKRKEFKKDNLLSRIYKMSKTKKQEVERSR